MSSLGARRPELNIETNSKIINYQGNFLMNSQNKITIYIILINLIIAPLFHHK